MTNKDMEMAIKIIRVNMKLMTEEFGLTDRESQTRISTLLTSFNYTETNIRYCYVLATGKNMII